MAKTPTSKKYHLNRNYQDADIPKMAKSPWQLYVTNLHGESILYFNGYRDDEKLFWGIAKVIKVFKGDKFDVVNARFGIGGNTKIRPVMVFDNHARRQLLTIKQGQYAEFYGTAQVMVKKLEPQDTNYKEGEYRYLRQWNFAAYMIQGKYLPTSFDVKKRNKEIASGETIDDFENLTEAQQETFNQIIEDIMKNFDDGKLEDEESNDD